MAISSAEPRLLCVAPNWLGDAILARAAIAHLGRGGVRTQVWARGAVGRVLEDLPGVEAILSQPPARVARFRAAWRLRVRRYDAVLILPPSASSAFAGWLVRAPVRVGSASEGRSLWLTHAGPPLRRTIHLQTHYLGLVEFLLRALQRAPGAASAAPPGLAVHDAERRAAESLLRAAGVGEAYVVLAPGARYGPAKKWPAERFAAVGKRLRARFGCAVVVGGEPADAADAAAVRAHDPQAIDLSGRTTLGALIGVLAGARAVVANDSGTMHLAAALGRPVVGVFGSTSPAWTAPRGPAATHVVDAPWCAPCFAKTCAQDFACMLHISPELVVDTITAAMQQYAAGPGAA